MKKNTPVTSSIWLISEKILSMGLVLFITIILARHLGPKSFGELNYLIAFVSLLSPFAAMGLNSIVTRELVLRPHDSELILGSSLSIRVIGVVTASLLAWGISPYYLDDGQIPLLCVLLIANVFTSLLVFDYWLQAHVANHYAVKVRFIVLLTLTITRLIAVYYDASIDVFIYIAGAELTLVGLSFLFVYRIRGAKLSSLKFKWREASNLLKQSWWLMLSGIAAVIYLKVDQIMLGLLSSAEQVGIYSVASRLSEAWYFFPAAIVASFFPKLLIVKGKSSLDYNRYLQKLNDFLFLFALIVAVTILFVGEHIVILLFTDSYRESAPILVVHIWAGVFIFMRALLSKWLIAENLLRFSLVSQLAGAVINVFANWFLIPEYGALGAAYATVVSYAVASYLILFIHSKTWSMAKINSLSLLLPFRLLRHGKNLYKLKE